MGNRSAPQPTATVTNTIQRREGGQATVLCGLPAGWYWSLFYASVMGGNHPSMSGMGKSDVHASI